MKKFVSVLLVAMLVVTCFATTAFAAEAGSANASVSSSQNVTPGQTVTLTVSVNGNFGNYAMTLGIDSRLENVAVSGITYNSGNGMCAWSSAENVASHSFTVTVTIPSDGKPGDQYSVSANMMRAKMAVPVEEDTEDGAPDGWVSVPVTSGGCTLTIVCDHEWDEGVVTTPAGCETEGVMTYTCIHCGETKTETIEAKGHEWTCGQWNKDETGHFHDHVCSNCGEKIGETHKEAHTMVPYAEETLENGMIRYYRVCDVCGWTDHKDVEPGTPPTGDISSMLTAGTAAIFASMMSVVALVVKRKTV